MPRLVLYPGSLLDIETDVIVNAANSSLMGGGGVDGVIHRAAGPALKEACKPLAPCPPGEVRVTEGFGLAPRLIFHTVGPIWHGGQDGEADILANCYRNCLTELSTAAFAALSSRPSRPAPMATRPRRLPTSPSPSAPATRWRATPTSSLP
jgi:O-acetyl-ADP-ribose deacetylase (regulator of RNase III)